MPNLRPHLTKQYVLDRIKVNPDTGCWEWQQSVKAKDGYGQIGYAPYSVHRLAFILWKGDPGPLVVRHQCPTPSCCNPAHLLSGTHYDNWHDSEEGHRARAAKRRGIPSRNRIPVTIDGIRYESKVEALRMLRISPVTLERLIAG